MTKQDLIVPSRLDLAKLIVEQRPAFYKEKTCFFLLHFRHAPIKIFYLKEKAFAVSGQNLRLPSQLDLKEYICLHFEIGIF